MFTMRLHDARQDVFRAQSWRDVVRSVGNRGWSGFAEWSSAYPTYDEAVEAAEVALEQAEERLAAELEAEMDGE